MHSDTDDTKKLLTLINKGDQRNAIKEINKLEDFAVINECYPGSTWTLLQLCCMRRLGTVVKHLLKKGVNPTVTTQYMEDEPVSLTN